MTNWHKRLEERSATYRGWHAWPWRHFFHWVLFVAAIGGLGSLIYLNAFRAYEEVSVDNGTVTVVAAVSVKSGEFLLKLRDNISPSNNKVIDALKSVNGSIDLDKNKEIQKLGILTVKIPDEANVPAVINAFSHRGNGVIEYAEADSIHQVEATPNDPSYGSQWFEPKISAPTAWDITKCQTPEIIAILDTGVDSTHPDLAANITPGWNFYDNNSDTSDVYGHGTAVAGTAGAIANNGRGVAGTSWGCKIMPIRISALNGGGSTSAMANGLVFAADHGARAANISYRVSTNSTVKTAAQYFMNHGGVVTIAAGNESSLDNNPDNPYVLTVGATDSTDTKASWSNWGTIIDLVAPGTGIYTTNRGTGYGSWSGTSFSAPITAAIGALIISANPSLTGYQVQQILKDSVDDLGTTGWDQYFGWGRINAYKAVLAATGGTLPPPDAIAPVAAISSPANSATVSGTTPVDITATDNTGVTSVSLKVDGTVVGTSTVSPYTFPWNTTTYTNGSHALVTTASDAAGNIGTSASVTVSVSNVADTTAPTITLISPTDSATVAGTVAISFNTNDASVIGSAVVKIDGAIQYSSSGVTSYSYSWNTKATTGGRTKTKLWPNGTHTIEIAVTDVPGNLTTKTITVTVNNATSGGGNPH